MFKKTKYSFVVPFTDATLHHTANEALFYYHKVDLEDGMCNIYLVTFKLQHKTSNRLF